MPRYMGTVTPENVSANVPGEAGWKGLGLDNSMTSFVLVFFWPFCAQVIDWEQPMKAVTELKPCTAASRGMIKQRLVVDNTLEVRHAALRKLCNCVDCAST